MRNTVAVLASKLLSKILHAPPGDYIGHMAERKQLYVRHRTKL